MKKKKKYRKVYKKGGKPIDLLGFDFAPPTKKYKVI